jgi:hypothetical protein
MAKGIHLTEDDVMALQISLAEAEKTIRTLKNDVKLYKAIIGRHQNTFDKIMTVINEHIWDGRDHRDRILEGRDD